MYYCLWFHNEISTLIDYLPFFFSRNWEVRNSENEKYFINICGLKANMLCGQQAGVSVCKKSGAKISMYGARAGDIIKIPTLPYGRKGFSITFNGTVDTKTGCENKKIQTKIIFQCHTKLVSKGWMIGF